MIVLEFTSKFERSYKHIVRKRIISVEQIDLALNKFMNNPLHPGLNLEKLSGSVVWTIRIDRKHRIFFTWIESFQKALLLDVGKHDLYRSF